MYPSQMVKAVAQLNTIIISGVFSLKMFECQVENTKKSFACSSSCKKYLKSIQHTYRDKLFSVNSDNLFSLDLKSLLKTQVNT